VASYHVSSLLFGRKYTAKALANRPYGFSFRVAEKVACSLVILKIARFRLSLVRTARAWMSRRVEAGLPALSGMFTRAEVTYAWPRPDGTAGSGREPVAVFTGEAVHAYLGHLPDQEIEAMLNELAVELGAALGQERLYVAFCDRTWILDAGEREG
jgi:hypothetical protein